jgi:D-alanine-D-alanine ligase
MKKLKIGVVFGGQSGEHDVSIQSARSVIENLDPRKFEILPIGISRDGTWHVGLGAYNALGAPIPPQLLQDGQTSAEEAETLLPEAVDKVLPVQSAQELDVIIPVLHGPRGEDGTVQGLFELMNIPYVGAGVLASAVGMDKAMMKTVFAQAGLKQCRYETVLRSRFERDPEGTADSLEHLGYPCFVKPANMGSSVGVTKAKNREGLIEALHIAARYDRKIIVEEAVDGREIEVAVLGNEDPIASVPGEIISGNEEFYDYNAKYIDGNSTMIIPADLTPEQSETVREMALQAFRAIDGSGLSRVDFFLDRKTGEFLINEINTFPGFTIYSMYPKLWEASGIPYDQLLEKLIHLAIERHADQNRSR